MYPALHCQDITRDWSLIRSAATDVLEEYGIVSTVRKRVPLKEIKEKNESYQARRVGKLIPLFDKHDFWFTQPVPKYFEQVKMSEYDQPVEVKTLDDV